MTAIEIQALINRNAAAQAALLADNTIEHKAARIAVLQEEQKQLYTRRDAARRDEQGRTPRERAGIGYQEENK